MASELRVNTLKDAAGNNSVAMTYVANGSAKAWNCFNASGTISLRDSLNTASLTDNGLSNFDTNFTNSFANDDYSFQATNQNPAGANNQIMAGTSATSKTTGEFGIRSQNYAGTFSDVDGIMTTVHGDLA
jgi:hypothetical protein